MKRMVVIATPRRGVLDPHEPLEADVEAEMLERVYAEACEPNIYWNSNPKKLPPARYQPRAMVDRMIALAEKRKVG